MANYIANYHYLSNHPIILSKILATDLICHMRAILFYLLQKHIITMRWIYLFLKLLHLQ